MNEQNDGKTVNGKWKTMPNTGEYKGKEENVIYLCICRVYVRAVRCQL